jgi:pimeloyl-ACP methyl ester carboxylesterase
LLFDQRCHGQSRKDPDNLTLGDLVEDTRRLLLSLQIEQPVLIGHSMGGMAAIEYFLRWPEAVRALVLVEAHTNLETTARLLGPGVLSERTPPEIAREIEAIMSRGAQWVSPDLFESLRVFDARERIASLACPVLCLWGDRYGDISPEQWPQVLEAFGYAQVPNLSFRCIPNSHHFVMLEQPQETLRAIQEFFSIFRT